MHELAESKGAPCQAHVDPPAPRIASPRCHRSSLRTSTLLPLRVHRSLLRSQNASHCYSATTSLATNATVRHRQPSGDPAPRND